MNADLAAVFFSLILGFSVYWIQGETEVIRLELNTTSLVGLQWKNNTGIGKHIRSRGIKAVNVRQGILQS